MTRPTISRLKNHGHPTPRPRGRDVWWPSQVRDHIPDTRQSQDCPSVSKAIQKKAGKIQSWNNMTTMGKLDTSDMMVVIRRAMDISPDNKVHGGYMGPTWVLSAPHGPMFAPWTLLSGSFQSAKIEWAGGKHTNPYIAKRVTEWTNFIVDTLSTGLAHLGPNARLCL